MIEWHQVNFLRETGWMRYTEEEKVLGHRLVAHPIGNSDPRLRVVTEWTPHDPLWNRFDLDNWLPLERQMFKALQVVLAALEGEPCARCKYADGCLKAGELEEEIEAMRVADPSELAAQLIQAKRDLSSLKAGIANHLVLALGQMPIDHLARVYTGRALALLGLDVAKEAGL